MKKSAFQLGSAALLFVAAAGCVSHDYKKGYDTSLSIERASDAVQAQTAALRLAMGTLDHLVNSPAADLRIQAKRFRITVDRLERASIRTINAGVQMRNASVKFFEEWDREMGGMNYKAIRDRSSARRTEVAGQFDAVAKRCADVQDVVQPLISYLRDIERALGMDLTLDGLAALRPVAENTRKNADKVETALSQLSESLSEASRRMSPIVAAPPSGP